MSPAIALAFTAGMIAAFNPCGFALLPTYIGAFVAGDTSASWAARILGAARVSITMAAAFALVFTAVGLILNQVAAGLAEYLPWVTIVIGMGLVAGGLWLVSGRTLRIRLPEASIASGRAGLVGVFSYGVTFAVASISCTIGPLLAITGAGVSGSTVERIALYVAFALGMASIVAMLTVAASFAQRSISMTLRSLARYSLRAGGLLMIVAGAYAAWYGRWELGVYAGDLSSDPLVRQGEAVRSAIVSWVRAAGPTSVLVVAVTLVAAAAIQRALHVRTAQSETAPDK